MQRICNDNTKLALPLMKIMNKFFIINF